MINKAGDVPFNSTDEHVCFALGQHVSVALLNAQLAETTLAAKVRSEALLELMRDISSKPDMRSVLLKVMSTCRELLQTERCTVFILDKVKQQLWSTVADGTEEIRISVDAGIAGYVASTGQLANVQDAYADPRFERTIDNKTGYRTRTMLCVPIKHFTGGLIGVIQFINKRSEDNNRVFSAEDESMAEALSSHIGVIIYNAQLYDRAIVAQRRSDALLELMKTNSSHAPINIVIEHAVVVCLSIKLFLTQAMHNILNAADVVLYLVNPIKKEFYCRVF